MLRVLRRRLEITSEAAPPPAPAVDVRVVPPRTAPAPSSLSLCPSPTLTALSRPAASTSLPEGPPAYTPGCCYHPAHVDLDGHRYGLLPEPGEYPHRASLIRCHHLNPDGC